MPSTAAVIRDALKSALVVAVTLAVLAVSLACGPSAEEIGEELGISKMQKDLEATQAALAAVEAELEEVNQRSHGNHDLAWGNYTDLWILSWALEDDVQGPRIGRFVDDAFDKLVDEAAECLTSDTEEVTEPFADRERFVILRLFALWRLLEGGFYYGAEDFRDAHTIIC